MAFYKVGTLAELEERGRLLVELDGRSIGVVRVNGHLFALRNRCLHQLGPLCEGTIFPAHRARADPDGTVTEYLDESQPVICCPWHGWEYDLETGTCLADPTRRVPTYDVALDGDDIVVALKD